MFNAFSLVIVEHMHVRCDIDDIARHRLQVHLAEVIRAGVVDVVEVQRVAAALVSQLDADQRAG